MQLFLEKENNLEEFSVIINKISMASHMGNNYAEVLDAACSFWLKAEEEGKVSLKFYE